MFVIPFFFAMAFLIFDVRYVGLGVLIALITEWVPAVNPVRELFSFILRSKVNDDFGKVLTKI